MDVIKFSKLRKISKIDMAWVAGFYEGEGCAGFFKIHNTRALRVNIAQKDKTPLEKIRRLFGFGAIHRHSTSNVYYLYFSATSSRIFLNSIKSYIVSKYKIKQLNRALKLDKKHIDSVYGSQLGCSTLTINKVRNIRKAKKSNKWIASRYKLPLRMVQRIRRKDTWKNV